LPPEPLPPDPPELLDEHAAAVTTNVAIKSRCVTMRSSRRVFTDKCHVSVAFNGAQFCQPTYHETTWRGSRCSN
jgi:hypothetical protein